MTSRQVTVVEQKQHFVQLRKQYLSRGIVPSDKLKRIAREGGVELSVLKGALDKVNRELKQHSRKVYSRQMTTHVIEQIDKFYWASGARSLEPDAAADADDISSSFSDATAHTLSQTADLSQDDNISKLPTRWDPSADPHEDDDTNDDHDNTEQKFDQDTYLTLLTRLQTLSARRLTLQQKLNTYQTLLTLLKPYRDPLRSIQPNLVGRDAPLAQELGKTRTLAIRVAGRVGERFAGVEVPSTAADVDGDDDDVEMGGEKERERMKVERVLNGW